VGEAAGWRAIDLAEDAGAIEAGLEADRPEAVLHAAAVSSVAAVERDPERARAVNVGATGRIAAWCANRSVRLVVTSTDMVFGGARMWSREEWPTEPRTLYGQTKAEAESRVMERCDGGASSLVVRLSLLYGPSRCGRPGFYDDAVAALRTGRAQAFFDDEFRTPLPYASAATGLVELLAHDAVTGVVHLGGRDRLSRFELFRRVATGLGLDPSLVLPSRLADAPGPRPADVSLDTTRLATLLPGLDRPPPEVAVGG
jgi:dTDP-4-dehydrorhamnose reductase